MRQPHAPDARRVEADLEMGGQVSGAPHRHPGQHLERASEVDELRRIAPERLKGDQTDPTRQQAKAIISQMRLQPSLVACDSRAR